MKKLWWAAFAAIVISSCQVEEPCNDVTLCDNDVFYATICDEGSSKTVMDENNNIRWSAGDQLVIFKKTSLGLKYQIQDAYVGETSGYFSKVVSASGSDDFGTGISIDHNIAYYPYSNDVKFAKSGNDYTLKVALPAEQIYAPDSFGNGSFPMAAVSVDTDLTFKNVCGGIKLQLKGTCKVASIKIEGNNGEKLSGAAVVTVYADEEAVPSIAMSDDASTSVILNCGDGVQLNETTAVEFIMSLPPTIFTKGFTVTITDFEKNVQTIKTDKPNEVKRSSLLVMPELTLETIYAEIAKINYIDEYGTDHGPGVQIGDVVWAPVNCGYKASTSGCIGFPCGKLYQWGRRYGQGYSGDAFVEGSGYVDCKDEIVPSISSSAPSLSVGQNISNKDVYYKPSGADWTSESSDYLWNTGTDSDPVRSDYDPCPTGWRVPTLDEVTSLRRNRSSLTTSDGYSGFWFSGPYEYSESAERIFLPLGGRFTYYGEASDRGTVGYYWTSAAASNKRAYYLLLYSDYVISSANSRIYGCSVRCVQDYIPQTMTDAVDLSAEGTANSYIVSKAGAYKFTTTKGNSSESVGSIASAQVLWETFGTDVTPNVGDLVRNVKYENGAISFETPSEYKEGNAVIAAKDASGIILWSWHIWLTDQPQGQVYYNNAGTMMDRNLGATSANPGDVGALGLLYQWGRKDPFLGSSSISSSTLAESTIVWPPAISSNSSNGTIEFATANPTTFITYNTNNSDWYYTGSSSTDNTRWTISGSAKSIYDPCPVGWRVPDGDSNGVWSKALGSSNYSSGYPYDGINKGMNFSGKFGSDSTIWVHASGYRYYIDGSLGYVGNCGYCWSASLVGVRAHLLYLGISGSVHPSDIGHRAYGCSVRCVKE